MKIIILAGGSGTRLWPLSRERYPKQFIKFQGKECSLFQDTFKRSLMLSSIDDIYIVTNEKYKFLVMGSVEELGYRDYNPENILVEPEAKNTLPAICAGVNQIVKKENDLIVVFPSDHVILKDEEFISIINESKKLASDFLITFGVKPDLPNTGYGYISPGKQNLNGFMVNSFKEKPTMEKAQEYIKQGYYWNAGIFMFSSNLFFSEVEKYSPEISSAFKESKTIGAAFNKIHTKISIDYGLLEKSDKVAVVPVDIGWNDLGSFDSFYDVFEADTTNNISDSKNILLKSNNNIIQSHDEKIVAAVGVDDLIIIDNKDALLICKKDESQKVKDVVEILRERADLRTEYSTHDYTPWGKTKLLEEAKDTFKIKRITINAKKKISYQMHHHRIEHWIVVKGIAKVNIDGEEKFIKAGESIFFRAGQKHCLENPGNIPLEIIEVQIGDYLEDDDIIRFEDNHIRK